MEKTECHGLNQYGREHMLQQSALRIVVGLLLPINGDISLNLSILFSLSRSISLSHTHTEAVWFQHTCSHAVTIEASPIDLVRSAQSKHETI